MRWLEVSLRLRAELVEPAAELLARYAPGGVAIEAEEMTGPPASAGSSVLLVRAYLENDETLHDRLDLLEAGLWHLGQIEPFPALALRWTEEEDWAAAWKEHYHPLPVGRAFLIQPAWLEPEAGSRLPILIDPGMAFGTGTHPTTQLCLEATEDHMRPGDVVVDLGCGSGILAIAAAKLGARRVCAFDLDESAVEAARDNVARNGLSEVVEVYRGTLPDTASMQLLNPDRPTVILANILAPVIASMLAQGLAETLAPDGALIVSGVLDHQVQAVEAAAQAAGLVVAEVRSSADWRALVLKPPRLPS